LGKLYTPMCLSPSSITWYRPRGVIFCGLEGNRRPGRRQRQPTVLHLQSLAGWLPVHRDQHRAQRSVTSMGSLYLFYIVSSKLPTVKWDWYVSPICPISCLQIGLFLLTTNDSNCGNVDVEKHNNYYMIVKFILQLIYSRK